MTWQQELGQKIKETRESVGMSQLDLAKKISVGRAQISNYENGKCDAPVNIVAEIAQALNAEFVVRGCKIARETPNQPALAIAEYQLCLDFDTEYHFPESAVSIKPTREFLFITARLRKANDKTTRQQ